VREFLDYYYYYYYYLLTFLCPRTKLPVDLDWAIIGVDRHNRQRKK
jgi:hypothetical protein